ncbi:MAG: hypothetical protein JJE04_22435 [Acidobacteriia bacterium]|nr:hypothetical protein [Terriglobia bacterium]
MLPRFSLLLALLAQLGAQNPPSPTPVDVAPGGVFRLPPVNPLPPEADPAPKTVEPGKPVMEYTGKPIQIPFACTEEMMTSFGMSCTDQHPCLIYSEISGFQPLGDKLFLTGNIHDGSSTMFSLFLASSDRGGTWTEPVERMKSAGLDRVYFFDLEAGWISGHVLQAIPRDPFYLVTTDGGKTWRNRPVFSEPRVGAIEKFWFESRTAGSMLMDRVQGPEGGARYERYETMTGGESWMIREVSSKPLPLKGAREVVANPDWRLRADSASKAHTIEQRDAGRWNKVAAFSVAVGECKPNFQLLTQPPGPPEPESAPVPSTPPHPRTPARPAAPRKP